MLSDLTSLLIRSVGLLIATTVLFWGVVGAAAARRTGRARGRGALIGGVLPVAGACWMLRPVRAIDAQAPVAVPPPAPQPATPTWGSPVTPPPVTTATWGEASTSTWGVPETPATWGAASVASTSTWGAPVPVPQVPYTPYEEVAPPMPLRGRSVTLGQLLLPLVAVVAGLAVIGALAEPLIVVEAPVVGDESVMGGSSVFTAAPLLVMLVLLVVAAGGFARWPRGVWTVLGAAVGATAILVALQILLVTHTAALVLSSTSRYTHGQASVGIGAGSYLLLTGGVLAFLWACASVASCPPRVPTSAP